MMYNQRTHKEVMLSVLQKIQDKPLVLNPYYEQILENSDIIVEIL